MIEDASLKSDYRGKNKNFMSLEGKLFISNIFKR